MQQSRMYFSLVGNDTPFFSAFYVGHVWASNDCASLLLIVLFIVVIGLAVCYRIGRRDAPYIMATAFTACIFSYVLSLMALPYGFLPDRYLLYPMTVLIPAALACALGGICLELSSRNYAILRALILVLPVLLFGATGVNMFQGRAMVNADIHTLRLDEHVQHALQKLPDTAIIAGWPDGKMDNIAFALRRVYLHYETHQALHTLYTLEMRRRMYILINALFDSNVENIDKLRMDGVTHVLIPLSLYKKPTPPRYFQPFSNYMQEHWKDWQKKPAAILDIKGEQVLYEDEAWRLVRLLP
jgi:hypothetical protein